MIAALAGITVGILTIVLARAMRGQHWVYAMGLVTLPSLYASFAFRVGDSPVGVRELVYGIPFIVAGLLFALVSARQSAVLVGAFWILHAGYDLVHDQFFTNPGRPGWYPVFCFAVDVVVGGYVLWLSRRIPDANLREA